MEENVALDSSKQKQFVKSIKGIKKLIKKNDAKGVSEKISAARAKDGKVQKKKRVPRGLVYLGHIPHGFYEHEMTQYFKQFGMVTNARVIRSKRTGNSKGFAFVEFKEPAVAEIVAETMNNYLMGKRLIKAAYIPPEKQKRHAKRKFWSTAFNPGSEGRLKMKKAYNANKDDQGDLQKARKLLSNVTKTKKKLSALGINYDFFSPVDVPEALVNVLSPAQVKQEAKTKQDLKQKKDKKLKEEPKKQATGKVQEKTQVKKVPEKVEKKHAIGLKQAKTPAQPVNKKQQALKEKKLKDSGIKPVEDFIKIQQESDDDSDSSYEFNSDEYEKMLSDEDDVSGEDSGSEEESEESDASEESDGENPPKLVLAPPQKVVQPGKSRRATKQKNESPKQNKKPVLLAQKSIQKKKKLPQQPSKGIKKEKNLTQQQSKGIKKEKNLTQQQSKGIQKEKKLIDQQSKGIQKEKKIPQQHSKGVKKEKNLPQQQSKEPKVAAKKSKFENRNTQKLANKQFKKKNKTSL